MFGVSGGGQVEVRHAVSSGANGEVSLRDTLLAFSAFKGDQPNQRPSKISPPRSVRVLDLAILDHSSLHSDTLRPATPCQNEIIIESDSSVCQCFPQRLADRGHPSDSGEKAFACSNAKVPSGDAAFLKPWRATSLKPWRASWSQVVGLRSLRLTSAGPNCTSPQDSPKPRGCKALNKQML